MKHLWNWVDQKNLSAEKKYALCLWIFGISWALMGLFVWVGAYLVLHAGLEWLLICTGYPVIVSWIAVFLRGCRHPFR